jgi:hypothetical protein
MQIAPVLFCYTVCQQIHKEASMSTMIFEVYDALKEAGASEEKA